MSDAPLTDEELNWFAFALQADAPDQAWDGVTAKMRRLVATIDHLKSALTSERERALEEAAAVAETCWPASDDPTDQPSAGIRVDASLTIAAAIRSWPSGDRPSRDNMLR